MLNDSIASKRRMERIADDAQRQYMETGVVDLPERDWEDLIDWLLDGGLSTHGRLLEWVEQYIEPQNADVAF